jgi:toxin YoeB
MLVTESFISRLSMSGVVHSDFSGSGQQKGGICDRQSCRLELDMETLSVEHEHNRSSEKSRSDNSVTTGSMILVACAVTYRAVIENSAEFDLKMKRSYLAQLFMLEVADLKSELYQPAQSFGKFQPVSRGLYARRINRLHRVVYGIDDDARTVTIYVARSHYE